MVPTAPLIAALGEDVTITPASTGVAVTHRGIIGRTIAYSQYGDEQYYADYVDLPAATGFVNGDQVSYRGLTAQITSVQRGSDSGWLRYILGR